VKRHVTGQCSLDPVSWRFTVSGLSKKELTMTDMHNSTLPVAATTTADKMRSVKAAWDKAPAGPKKDAALKHFQAAEKADTAHDDAAVNKELDAAAHALV
jgi:hypothetical protein